MIIGVKDLIKLSGVIIVTLCAVFVCTFMLNFYLDVPQIEKYVTDMTQPLYDAQKAMAKFCCYITGGCLTLIAFFMMAFYIKLYVDSHSKQLGILKAMGYSEKRIAAKFYPFGLSVFAGAALGFVAGYIYMPSVYKGMSIEGLPEITINFHVSVLLATVVAPTLIFSAFACFYAYFALKRPVGEMLRGKAVKPKKPKKEKSAETAPKDFLQVMLWATLGDKKSLAFFMAFASFCFSSMVQMGASMQELNTGAMSLLILVIGIILAATSTVMAMTSLLRGNTENIAVMRAFGYSFKEISLAVLAGYVPFILAGFAVGTVYQYGLLQVMVNIVFKDVGEVPEYTFNLPVFFATFSAFIAVYVGVYAISVIKMRKVSCSKTLRGE